MSAAITDLLTQVGQPGTVTSMTSPGKALGASSINVGSTANWPTGTAVYFAIRVVNPANVSTSNPSGMTAGTYTEWKGVVAGGSIVNQLVLQFGSDQVYPAGTNTQVFVVLSAARENAIVTWGTAQHNQDGSHSAVTAASVVASGNITGAVGTFNSLVISGASVSSGWTPSGITFTYSGNNGNKEFILAAGADPSTTHSVGDRFQVTRNTTPSTQSMAFTAASSQYATKASPAGLTSWTAYTIESWVYVKSYTGGSRAEIINRLDAGFTTGGFEFMIDSNGRLTMQYGTTSAFTSFISNQSVPLNRWIHVAGVVSSTSSKTGVLYINATLVPSFSSISTATALTQSSVDLRMGAAAGTPTGTYFDGYMYQTRIWSAALTQAQIEANMGLALTTATNLVFSTADGSFNDASGNGNNLTASGAISTQASNPYHAVEYGIITGVTTTTITVFCGTDFVIPNMTLTNAQYSNAKAPYGFPASRNKWVVDVIMGARYSDSGGAPLVFANQGWQISVPSGDWQISARLFAAVVNTSAGFAGAVVGFSTATSTLTEPDTWTSGTLGSTSTTEMDSTINIFPYPVSPVTQTVYYLNMASRGVTSTGRFIGNDASAITLVRFRILAECAYV